MVKVVISLDMAYYKKTVVKVVSEKKGKEYLSHFSKGDTYLILNKKTNMIDSGIIRDIRIVG